MKRNIRKHRLCASHAPFHYFIDCFLFEFKFQIQIQMHLNAFLLFSYFLVGPGPPSSFFFLPHFSLAAWREPAFPLSRTARPKRPSSLLLLSSFPFRARPTSLPAPDHPACSLSLSLSLALTGGARLSGSSPSSAPESGSASTVRRLGPAHPGTLAAAL
jgi:hypothetical protein